MCIRDSFKTIEKIKERRPLKYKALISLLSFDPVMTNNRSSIGNNRINVLLKVLYEENRITEVVAGKAKQEYSVLYNEVSGTVKETFDSFNDCISDKKKTEFRLNDIYSVSYTHLDVYKRQGYY